MLTREKSAKYLICAWLVGIGIAASAQPVQSANPSLAEKLQKFIVDRAVVEEIVFKHSGHGMYFARWQTNAFIVRRIDSLEEIHTPMARDRFYASTPTMDWAYLANAGGYQEEYPKTNSKDYKLALVGKTLLEEVLLLGFFGGDRESITWRANSCAIPGNDLNPGVEMKCQMNLTLDGVPATVYIQKTFPDPITAEKKKIELGIEYNYDKKNGVDFIPSSFRYGKRLGNKIFTASEYEILSIKLSDKFLSLDRFAPDQFQVIIGNESKPRPLPVIGMVHSNDTTYVKDMLGILTPTDREEREKNVNRYNKDQQAQRESKQRTWQRVHDKKVT